MQPLTLKDPIGPKVDVLDHGYIQAIEAWGCDERIIESARMSTNKGFKGWGAFTFLECRNPSCQAYSCDYPGTENETIAWRGGSDRCQNCASVLVVNSDKSRKAGDEKLLRYLYEHKHATPFEMSGMTVEVQAPIFVFREWHRHRTQSYSEMSARYTQMPDLHYVPSTERIIESSAASANKQASGSGIALSIEKAEEIQQRIASTQAIIYAEYEAFIKVCGIAKEIARLNTPVSRYSRMRASANLRNWLAFLTLRMDSAAQWEIRQFANQLGVFISELYPRTWELFVEGRQNA